jgi:hypothetical protein
VNSCEGEKSVVVLICVERHEHTNITKITNTTDIQQHQTCHKHINITSPTPILTLPTLNITNTKNARRQHCNSNITGVGVGDAMFGVRDVGDVGDVGGTNIINTKECYQHTQHCEHQHHQQTPLNTQHQYQERHQHTTRDIAGG